MISCNQFGLNLLLTIEVTIICLISNHITHPHYWTNQETSLPLVCLKHNWTQVECEVDEWQDFCHIPSNGVMFSSPPVGRGAVLLNQREFHTGFDFCGCQHVFGRWQSRLWWSGGKFQPHHWSCLHTTESSHQYQQLLCSWEQRWIFFHRQGHLSPPFFFFLVQSYSNQGVLCRNIGQEQLRVI